MQKPFKVALIADLHYYSKQLGTSGEAYVLRRGAEQKCLAESGDILEEAFAGIAQSGADAVIIAGDLTNNGEVCSHAELREKLYTLNKRVPIYLLTATHDWCSDGRCYRYDGEKVYADVPTLKQSELAEYYRDFGFSTAIATFITEAGAVSYVAEPVPDVRILMLNDDQNGHGRAGYSEPHLQWIEAQIKDARENQKELLAVQHHPIIPPIHPILTGGNCCGNRKELVARMADAGLRCLAAGHMHMQTICTEKSPNGNLLTQISLGALCGVPGNVIYATLSKGSVDLSVDSLQSCRTVLEQQTFGVVTNLLDGAKLGRTEFEQRAVAMFLPKLKHFYPFVRKWAYRMDTMTLAQAYATLRREWLLLLPKMPLGAVEQVPMREAVQNIFFRIFGEETTLQAEDTIAEMVIALFSVPRKIAPFSRRARQLREGGKALINKEKADGKHIQNSL